MKKSKITSTALAVMMGVSTLTYGAFASPQQVDAEKVRESVTQHFGGTPMDLGIANDEKLIEMLKERGTIAPNASAGEAETALKTFLKQRSSNSEFAHEEGDLLRRSSKVKIKIKKRNGTKRIHSWKRE